MESTLRGKELSDLQEALNAPHSYCLLIGAVSKAIHAIDTTRRLQDE